LIVIGDSSTLRHERHWRAFVDWCRDQGCYTTASDVVPRSTLDGTALLPSAAAASASASDSEGERNLNPKPPRRDATLTVTRGEATKGGRESASESDKNNDIVVKDGKGSKERDRSGSSDASKKNQLEPRQRETLSDKSI
jgi:hypothetical protein